jgi:enoyl-CoA hydratase
MERNNPSTGGRAMPDRQPERIARIILDSPALDERTSRRITDACERLAADDDISVVVLTGAGDVFCTGGEAGLHRPAAALAALDRPVIAAVNGPCLGAGLELALAADIRIAADTAVFSLPQVAEGTLPGDGGTQRLARTVGPGKAFEMLLTASEITAAEALESGLVSRVYPAAELEAETEKLAGAIAAKGPLALRYVKEAVLKGMDLTLEQGLRLEADLYFLLHTTADRTEGITSYLEKRDPEYRGE